MAEERVQRRLAAILSADVVGYSRLMGIDEAGTLARLKVMRRDFFDPLIAAHSGRIFKLMGDGALVEFASAVDAVTCAIEVQKQIQERNSGIPEDSQIQFRIGINVGDIIVEGDDIYGDGVNVAARIQALADPGGIYISRGAADQVRDKVPIKIETRGEQNVKNIARPIEVFCIIGEGREAAIGGRTQIRNPCSDRGGRRQANDRRPALCQHERRTRAGIFCRRYDRGHPHRAVALPRAVRHLTQLCIRLQRQAGQRAEGRRRSLASSTLSRAACARRAAASASPCS